MPSLQQQASDFLAYLAVPTLALLLPARWSRALVARLAGWNWMLAPLCHECWVQAAAHTDIDDEHLWKRRWRCVEMMDARDTFMLGLGRSRAVLDEIGGVESLETVRGRVMIGMHWGPQISVLRLLAEHGMPAALIYREVEGALARRRPFYWLFQRMALRELKRSCQGRAIPVRGAMEKLRERLKDDGVVMCVLDAPPISGRSVLEGRVLERRAVFNAGFPELLEASGKEYVCFAVGLDPAGALTKVLYLDPARRVSDPGAFLVAYCELLDRYLKLDSAHWRIWQVAGQFFPDSNDKDNP